MFNLHGIVLCANFMPPYYQGARYTLCGEAALEDNGLRGAGGVPFTPLPPDAPHHAPLCHRKIPGPERQRYFTFYTVFLQLRRYFSQRGGGIAILARTSVDE